MKKILSILAFSFLSLALSAQDNITQMAVDLPQAMSLNPAVRSSSNFVSIPIIGSLNIGLNNCFSLNEVIDVTSGGNYLSLASMAEQSNSGALQFGLNTDIVNVGFYVTDIDFLQVSLRARAFGSTTHPTGAYELLSDNTLGESRNYDISINPSSVAWAQLGVAYSRPIANNFTVGIRLNYLSGIASVQSPQGVHFNVDKQYDKYMLSGDYNMNLGGLASSNGAYSLNNSGFSVDLGGTFTSNDNRITASVSVSDFGFVSWNGDGNTSYSIKNPNSSIEYTGLGDILGNESLNFNNMLDSLTADFNNTLGVDTVSNSKFNTYLPTTIQAMAGYALGDDLQHNLSIGFIGQFPEYSNMVYSVSVGYAYRSPNKVWQFMTNYSYTSSSPLNIGLGVVATTRVFQFYISTNNIISPLSLNSARNLNLNLGMNFRFGRVRY